MQKTLAILNEMESAGLVDRYAIGAAMAREIFSRKARSRQAAATLPIEEKLRRLVIMQMRANEIRKSAGRPTMRVWELS
jgi:hypothetical protein